MKYLFLIFSLLLSGCVVLSPTNRDKHSRLLVRCENPYFHGEVESITVTESNFKLHLKSGATFEYPRTVFCSVVYERNLM